MDAAAPDSAEKRRCGVRAPPLDGAAPRAAPRAASASPEELLGESGGPPGAPSRGTSGSPENPQRGRSEGWRSSVGPAAGGGERGPASVGRREGGAGLPGKGRFISHCEKLRPLLSAVSRPRRARKRAWFYPGRGRPRPIPMGSQGTKGASGRGRLRGPQEQQRGWGALRERGRRGERERTSLEEGSALEEERGKAAAESRLPAQRRNASEKALLPSEMTPGKAGRRGRPPTQPSLSGRPPTHPTRGPSGHPDFSQGKEQKQTLVK